MEYVTIRKVPGCLHWLLARRLISGVKVKHLLGVIIAMLMATGSVSIATGADLQKGIDAYQAGDFVTAYGELKDLARAGDPEAQKRLALMYRKGKGVSQDRVLAFVWRAMARFNSAPLAAMITEFGRNKNAEKALLAAQMRAVICKSSNYKNCGARAATERKTARAGNRSSAKQRVYDNTSDGLQALFEDIFAAMKNDNRDRYAPLVKGLIYENTDAWYRKTFGPDDGAWLSEQWARTRKLGPLERLLGKAFSKTLRRGRTEIKIRKFAGPDRQGTGHQKAAMRAMRVPTPLYSVRMLEPGKRFGSHYYNFVYIDGGFRWMGKMHLRKTARAGNRSSAKQRVYDNTSDGLQALFEDIFAAMKNGNRDRYAPLVKGLIYENTDAWYRKTFGPDNGTLLSDQMAKTLNGGAADRLLGRAFFKTLRKGRTVIKIRKFTGPGQQATGNQNTAMESMHVTAPLYSVRMMEPGKRLGTHYYNFVYIDGGFRWMGKMSLR